MAKKKSNNEKNEDNESNVQPINSEVGGYQAGLKLYRSHPSLPTFFFLLNQAVNAGIRFELLEPELIHLIDIDDDQYFGIYGSKYFNRHYDDLNFISPFRSSDADILSVCKSLWKLLENFQTEELWGYENYLVGISDYVYLHDQKPVIDAYELPEAGEPKSKSVLSNSLKEMVAALSAKENSAKIISDFAKQKGSPMVPWSAWVDHYLASRPGLSDGIRDLSEYFASYYVQDAESDFSEMELKVNTLKIDKGNAKALARICEFLIFNRLFKKVVYKNSNFDLQLFYRERIEHLSSRDALGDPADEAEYIIAISNLLMINAKLYVNSIEDGIVTEQELCRDFLADVTGECLDLACLTSLPSSGFEQMLVAINPYEGDRPDTYCVLEALRVVAYGMPGRWVPHLFDDMFEKAFGGIDFRLEPFLRQRIERAAKGWLIPFQHTKKIVRIFDDFWLDPYILEKISVALFKADQKNSNRCKFLFSELDEITQHSDFLDKDCHPAIFTRRFSHKIDFIDFKDAHWIMFCQSLVKAGQIRHACTILAIHFTILGVNKFFNIGARNNINIPVMVRLLNQLSGYDSFMMVRQSVADLFEMFGQVPLIYKGSLQEFLPPSKGTVVSFKKKAEDEIERHKKRLLDEGFLVTRLSSEAKDNLLKGYTLARTKELAVFNLSSDAVRNYVLAVEGELRSRAPDIDISLAEELKFCGVDVDSRPRTVGLGYRGVFRGLISIRNMVARYSTLSTNAQEKLSGFRALATHHEVSLFLTSMRDFARIRNIVQHADGSGLDPGDNLGRIEELMFSKGGLLRILCETG